MLLPTLLVRRTTPLLYILIDLWHHKICGVVRIAYDPCPTRPGNAAYSPVYSSLRQRNENLLYLLRRQVRIQTPVIHHSSVHYKSEKKIRYIYVYAKPRFLSILVTCSITEKDPTTPVHGVRCLSLLALLSSPNENEL